MPSSADCSAVCSAASSILCFSKWRYTSCTSAETIAAGSTEQMQGRVRMKLSERAEQMSNRESHCYRLKMQTTERLIEGERLSAALTASSSLPFVSPVSLHLACCVCVCQSATLAATATLRFSCGPPFFCSAAVSPRGACMLSCARASSTSASAATKNVYLYRNLKIRWIWSGRTAHTRTGGGDDSRRRWRWA